MPKRSSDDADIAAFAQLGRMTVAAGIRHLQPRLQAWLDDQLHTLLVDAGVAHNGVDKPRRSAKALATAEASLEAFTASPDAAPKRGRPPGSNGSGNYWASKTKEERSEIMRQRMRKRSDSFAQRVLKNQPKAKGVRVWPTTEMIDGRYTKAGAAKVLGVSVTSMRYVLAHAAKPIPIIRTATGGRPSTYNPADIEALAASRSKS